MYLDYATYQTMSLSPVSASDFAILEPEAETYVDDWTYGRARLLVSHTEAVQRVVAKVVDGLKSITGEQVSSYSNGTDSWSFVKPTNEQQITRLHSMALRLLPLDLVSGFDSQS